MKKIMSSQQRRIQNTQRILFTILFWGFVFLCTPDKIAEAMVLFIPPVLCAAILDRINYNYEVGQAAPDDAQTKNKEEGHKH